MRKGLLLLTILLLVLVPSAAAQGDPAVMAVNWLSEQQREDGGYPGDDIEIAGFVAMAYGAIGESNEPLAAWLTSYYNVASSLLDDDGTGQMINALVALGVDPVTFADGALIEQHNAALVGNLEFGNLYSVCSNLVGSINAGLDIPQAAVDYVLSGEIESGGFKDYPDNNEADFSASTMCGIAFAYLGEEDAVASSLAYLEATQIDSAWGLFEEGKPDSAATAIGIMTLTAAGEELSDWGNPENFLFSQMGADGMFSIEGLEGDEALPINVRTTALATLVFRGITLTSFAPVMDETATDGGGDDMAMEEGPALDPTWDSAVRGGFEMDELDTADDFFTTVVDPFTQEELYGVEILNWVATYQYTGFIIEQFVTAEQLLWMGEQDPTTWELIAVETLELLPDDVLAQLPEDVQAKLNP